MVKNPFASVGDARDMDLSTETGRFPEAGNGNLLQYSCLENSMDRGAWQATVQVLQRVRHNWETEHITWIISSDQMKNDEGEKKIKTDII